MSMIPEGYGAVPDRKRETAIRLIKASNEVLHDEGVSVIATSDGYHVPIEVLDKYEEMLSDDDLAIDSPVVPDPFSLKSPHTKWTAWAPSTSHEDERTLETGSTPLTETAANVTKVMDEQQTGVGTEVAPAAGEDGAEGDESKVAKKAKGEPAGNAAAKAWLNFAKKQDNWDDADAELGRDDLRAKYGSVN